MDWFQALLLGILQGLAEYLPISSSGHLQIAQELLHLDLSGAESLQFDVALHVATVLSTIVVLWHRFKGLCVSFFTFKRDDNFYMVCKLLISAIPVAIVGLLFKDIIEEYFENLTVVGACLIVTAVLLLFAYFTRTRTATGRIIPADAGHEISYFDAFIIGCAQAVAVLPGLSRSGTTIATGILLGDKRDKIARFSFLMVIIPILGEALLSVLKAFKGDSPVEEIGILPVAVGFVAAFIVGCAACNFMIKLVSKGNMVWFAVYCLAVGAICLVFN